MLLSRTPALNEKFRPIHTKPVGIDSWGAELKFLIHSWDCWWNKMLSEPSVIQNDRTTLYGFLAFYIPAALGLLSTYQHFPFHTTAITVPLRPYHTSHKHHSAARNKAHLFFATDKSLYLTSFGRRAVLYNENLWWFNTELKPYFSDFNFMQISP